MLSIVIIDILGLLCLALLGLSIYFFAKYKELKGKTNEKGQNKKKKVIIKAVSEVDKWGWDNAPTYDEINVNDDVLYSSPLPYGKYVVREVEVRDENDILGF